MLEARPADWEEAFLTRGLSQRARRVGAAYTGPGAGNDIARAARAPIPFTGGIPDPRALPVAELAAASATVLQREPELALEYGGVQGYDGLREWLATHWSAIDGLPLTPANFSLTNGSAHALSNVCETFLDAGDTVIVEAPSFPGSIRSIWSLGAKIETVGMDNDGLLVDELEARLAEAAARGEQVKLLYTIPNYHNPTGTTLTLGRRQRLLELCEQHDVLVVEDDAYGELGYEEALPPSLYALSGGRGVVKIGTFSKIIATGLRVGWVQATPPIIEALLTTRFEMGISPFLLHTIAEFAANGRLEAHIAGLCDLYRRKRDIMLNELRERCSSYARWTEPKGGFFLWLELNADIDPVALGQHAVEEGVAYAGGRAFFVTSEFTQGTGWWQRADNANSRFVRLAFSYTAEEEIPEGIRRLARAMQLSQRA